MFQPVKIKAHLHFQPSKVGWMEEDGFTFHFQISMKLIQIKISSKIKRLTNL